MLRKFECLESREMLTASVNLVGDVLVIQNSAQLEGNDVTIVGDDTASEISVIVTDNQTKAEVKKTFSDSKVSSINIRLGNLDNAVFWSKV